MQQCTSSRVDRKKKLSDDAETITPVASVGSNNTTKKDLPIVVTTVTAYSKAPANDHCNLSPSLPSQPFSLTSFTTQFWNLSNISLTLTLKFSPFGGSLTLA